MATIKSFSDLEQSKKLAEILPLESADMFYECTKEEPEYKVYVGGNIAITYNLFSYRNGHTIPCWSLTALLGVIPKIINNETLSIGTSAALWHVGYRNIYFARTDNLIDACYEMIMRLHELKML